MSELLDPLPIGLPAGTPGTPEVPERLAYLWQDAAVAMRRAIVAGELKPGERVSEARLAETLGISRQPVRDAIRTLVQEGLLVQHGNSTVVARCSADDIRDLYRFRLHLETYAIRLAAGRVAREDEAAMRATIEAIRAASAAGDWQRRVAADLHFHRTLCRASGDRWLVAAWERLAPTLEATIILAHKASAGGEHTSAPPSPAPALDERSPVPAHQACARDGHSSVPSPQPSRNDQRSRHRQILEALLEGDAAGAEALLRDSLIGPVERLIERLFGEAAARAQRGR